MWLSINTVHPQQSTLWTVQIGLLAILQVAPSFSCLLLFITSAVGRQKHASYLALPSAPGEPVESAMQAEWKLCTAGEQSFLEAQMMATSGSVTLSVWPWLVGGKGWARAGPIPVQPHDRM